MDLHGDGTDSKGDFRYICLVFRMRLVFFEINFNGHKRIALSIKGGEGIAGSFSNTF